jgi:dTDP-glucose 4,6-dehydratase
MVDLNGKRILVTGGSGFIGSNFIELIDRLYKITAIVNLDKGGVGSRDLSGMDFRARYFHFKLDIRHKGQLDWLSTWQFDYVFHFAAESHVDRSISGPFDFVQNNVMGTTNLFESIRQHQPNAKIVNISTDEVYGHLGVSDNPFTESSPLAPRSPYSASKAASDLIVNSYVETFGLNAVTTRCCNNFGKHQADEKFIPTVIRNMVKGEPIPVYGTGQNIREWIYVDDHNKSILEIADFRFGGHTKECWQYPTVYNIGSGLEMTNLEMIDWIAKILKVEPILKFVEDRKGHDFRYAIDSINYNRGFRLMTDEGFVKTVEFYKDKYQDQRIK